jgi:hypothetical protein
MEGAPQRNHPHGGLVREVPIIGPNRKRFKRFVRARASDPKLVQAVLITERYDGSFQMTWLHHGQRVSSMLGLLELTKLDLFLDSRRDFMGNMGDAD